MESRKEDSINIQLANGSNHITIAVTGTTTEEVIAKYEKIKATVLPDWIGQVR